MILPVLDMNDLAYLKRAMPGLEFSDDERQKALLTMSSKDFQAAPGSGKTTLLAAKLMLLARKWQTPHQGICVISHTNVAKNEIGRRLGATAEGATVLGYPHFVGTIHSFVNTFLALPYLYSAGGDIDAIDNEVFATRAVALMQFQYTLKGWVGRNQRGLEAVRTLRFQGADLDVGWEEGDLPGENTPTRKQANKIKWDLAQKGVFRHDDMFAFAARLLSEHPSVPRAASLRFPLVLIDEMQDTTAEQERLISSVFDDSVVIQRFGDLNQRIMSSGAKNDGLTFPRSDHLTISSTKRFPSNIAKAVCAVQELKAPISTAEEGGLPPILILYDDESIVSVIDRFGQLVLAKLDDTQIQDGQVKAICARKSSEATSQVGRHITDYFQGYVHATGAQASPMSIRALLTAAVDFGQTPESLLERAKNAKRSVLLALKAGGCTRVKELRDASGLNRAFSGHDADYKLIRKLIHELAVSPMVATDAAWNATVQRMFDVLSPYFDIETTFEEFAAHDYFGGNSEESSSPYGNVHTSHEGGRSVQIQVATTMSVKGETHVATLVLEGIVRFLNKHDVASAMDSLALNAELRKNAPNSLRGAYRNLYVAMSRPTHLLAVAARADQTSTQQLEGLRALGWEILSA